MPESWRETLPCPLLDNVRLFTEACSFLSAEDLDWIMGRGVAEWLSWRSAILNRIREAGFPYVLDARESTAHGTSTLVGRQRSPSQGGSLKADLAMARATVSAMATGPARASGTALDSSGCPA